MEAKIIVSTPGTTEKIVRTMTELMVSSRVVGRESDGRFMAAKKNPPIAATTPQQIEFVRLIHSHLTVDGAAGAMRRGEGRSRGAAGEGGVPQEARAPVAVSLGPPRTVRG